MARKTTFSRHDIETAALSVLEREGLAAVTARRVADALGASTAPVYSNFACMDDLVAAVLARASERIVGYCRRRWSDDPFLDMGIGYVRFACDHPQLFRALYLDSDLGRQGDAHVFATLLQDLDDHPYLGALPAGHKNELLFQVSIYTLGIATTVVTGMWPDPDFADVERWLRSVGGLLTRASLESAGLPIPAELDRRLGEFVAPWRHSACSEPEDTPHD
jgi:AcrR family transcriptional regulator